jgi:MFS superfamily sulfate permease-like transporter
MPSRSEEVPRGSLRTLAQYAKSDALAGFLVFLIALPLCLGIAKACGFPPIAGIFTAVVGGLIAPWISNSELTIKGPAAGLIVIVAGAVAEFGEIYSPKEAYQLALGIGFVAGLIQIIFGLTRSGILGEFFPTAVVHGMLAAIGVIIFAKQFHVALGVMDVTSASPIDQLRAIPSTLGRLNPDIAIIGTVSLAILFLWPHMPNKLLRKLPAPMLVLLVAVPLGMYFDLSLEHTYTFVGKKYSLGQSFLVAVPSNLLSAITHPDFRAVATPTGAKWILLYALIGSLESLLSAKAIDLIDPWRRKTNLNRDLLAVGIGNTLSASIGGLPMISEIVRSKANVDNGGKTRFANLFHGLFLLGFAAFLSGLIHRIPLAALAAMLVYTGTRLASPREFINIWKIGREQLLIFMTTLIAVLCIDLLVGVVIGIATKFLIHAWNGVPLKSFFKPFLDIEPHEDGSSTIHARGSAVFSNWIPFKRQIEHLGLTQRSNLIIDLSETRFVDHSVMEKLHELQEDFEQEGLTLELIGLEAHRKLSDHAFSARRRGMIRIRRLTIVAEPRRASELADQLMRLGATSYVLSECRGMSRRIASESDHGIPELLLRLEVLVPIERFEGIVGVLRREAGAAVPLTICAETVEVVRPEPTLHYSSEERSRTDLHAPSSN